MEEQELDVIFNGVFGSKLYGLDTPESDTDYKGIYLPTFQQVLFNDYRDSIDEQTKELDTTFYSVNKFINIVSKCDIVSYDMIHTPNEFTTVSSPLWEEIRKCRSDLYCKNVRGLLGYIKTQSGKYAHKVQRYDEMIELQKLINCLDDDIKIENTTLPEMVQRMEFKYISFSPENKDIRANIDVCGSRYQLNADVSYLRIGLEAKLKRYGERTKKGSLSKGDFKSISHSLRCLLQLEEIIETRDLIFPLVKRDEIMKVKMGKVSQEDCMSIITGTYDRVIDKLQSSDLPEYNDNTRIKNLVLNHYLK